MTPGPSRYPLAPLGLLAAFAVVLVAAVGTGRGQPPAGAADRGAAARPSLKRTYLGIERCRDCHTTGAPAHANADPDDPPLARLVLRTEFKTWEDGDKHRYAFDALKGDRGKTMGKLLGYDVTAERACLSCHATGFQLEDSPGMQKAALPGRKWGVSCTACHGLHREWAEKHVFESDWRKLSAVEKSRQFGLTDLRDPVTRAELCSSCHVGNPAEGKTVTHAMYAAGHPPLPGFEVNSFLTTMPVHWEKPEDVEAFQKDTGLRERNHVVFSEPRATKSVVLGGVVALRDAMRLLAGRAESDPAPLGDLRKTRPDYAQFDCYACHHDLKIPVAETDPDPGAGEDGGRQARGYDHHFDGLIVAGVPGRPQPRPWPLALARLALVQTGTGRDAYRDAVKDLYAAFDDRPFGDPARVPRAAKRLEVWAQEMIGAVESSRFDDASPRRLLDAVLATPAAEVTDYDSARQWAWAFRSIYSDWKSKPKDDARVAAVLAELDRSLKLDPYAVREPRTRLVSAGRSTGDALRSALLRLSEDEFQTSTARAAAFDPVAFHKGMKRLSDLLAAPAR